jgi:hypothetical protein
MNRFEVSCINLAVKEGLGEVVTHMGNRAQGWCINEATAIQWITRKREVYVVLNWSTGLRSLVGVARPEGKAPLLRAHVDGKWNDDLMTQARCGGKCRLNS